MTLRTPERLKAMFQASKARKEKEHQQKLKARQQQYRDLCKQADKLLKEALQDEKRKRMEQLQALAEKCRQKPLKWSVTELYITSNRYIEKDADWMHYYQTREELKQAEARGEGKINWDVLDNLIKMTKEELGLI